jgi:hypothetical protein
VRREREWLLDEALGMRGSRRSPAGKCNAGNASDKKSAVWAAQCASNQFSDTHFITSSVKLYRSVVRSLQVQRRITDLVQSPVKLAAAIATTPPDSPTHCAPILAMRGWQSVRVSSLGYGSPFQ